MLYHDHDLSIPPESSTLHINPIMFERCSSTAAFGRSLRSFLQRGDGERVIDYEFRLIQPTDSDLPPDCSRNVDQPYTCLSHRVRLRRAGLLSLCVVLMALGLLHILQAFIRHLGLGTVESPPPKLTSTIRFPNALHDAQPVPCHSHNDYWRPRPLLDAMSVGCTSVEADVWLIDDQLYIGHSLRSVDRNKSFRHMYLNPLLEILEHGMAPDTVHLPSPTTPSVFHRQPNQTMVLLVDLKHNGLESLHRLRQDLEPFRAKGYLTYYNGEERIEGAMTIVVSGREAPFDAILADRTHRDIFFDAPLERLWQPPRLPLDDNDERTSVMDYGSAMADGLQPSAQSHEPFDATNSFYASTSFRSAVGYVWRGHLSSRQMRIIRGQIKGAKRRGLKVRYWDTPTWPIELRNHVWHVLTKEGADVLSVDDVEGCAVASWKATHKQGWSSWWSH